MVEKLVGFYRRLVCHPVPVIFALLFWLQKSGRTQLMAAA